MLTVDVGSRISSALYESKFFLVSVASVSSIKTDYPIFMTENFTQHCVMSISIVRISLVYPAVVYFAWNSLQ